MSLPALLVCTLSACLQLTAAGRAQAPVQQPSAATTVAVGLAPARERALSDAITVDAGASCLQAQRLVAHVKMWLGRDSVAPDLRVRVKGDPHKPRELMFDITRGKQTRHRAFSPSPESCDDAHAVVGLAIALAIDAERLEKTLLHTEPAPRMRIAQLQLGVAYDMLPGGSLGVQLGAELGALPWLSFRGDAFAHCSWSDTIVGSRGHFDALLAAGSLQLCAGGWPDARMRMALCTGAALGAVHAWGTDYAPSTSATGLWFAARSGVRIDVDLGLRWLLDLDVISAIYSPSFEAQRAGGNLSRQPSSTGFLLSLGPALSF